MNLKKIFRVKQDATPEPESVEVQAHVVRSIQGKAGRIWEAVLIAPGESKSKPKYNWTPEVLRMAVDDGVFEGVPINAYQVADGYYSHVDAKMEALKDYLIQEKAGVTKNVRYVDGQGVVSNIEFAERYDWIPVQLADNPDFLGLSIDSRVTASASTEPIPVTKILAASSVDIVTRPAAGGKFLRAVADQDKDENNKQEQEDDMDKRKMFRMLQSVRPDLTDGKSINSMSDDEVTNLIQQALAVPEAGTAEPPEIAQQDKDKEPVKEPDKVETVQQGMTMEELRKELDGFKREQDWEKSLRSAMSESNLPDHIQKRLREKWEPKVGEDDGLKADIKAEVEWLAAQSVPGFDIPDQSRVKVGVGPMQKIQIGLDKAFGITQSDFDDARKATLLNGKQAFPDLRAAQAEDWDNTPSSLSLRELYIQLSGDPDISGHFRPERISKDIRAAQDFTSSTFSYALGNTLHRRLVKDFREPNFQEDLLISIRKTVTDFKSQEAVNVGYFPDIATVNPENEDYAEIATVTDEESTYTITQKGNLMSVTRKMIFNDDISLLQRLVGRLGRAARRTHAKAVWAFFTGNATCSDGTAWFTSGHGNLTNSALSFATAIAAYKALAKMTEKDSGERIGLLDGMERPTLVYPIDLMEVGEEIVNDEIYYATDDLTDKTRNPLRGKVNGAMISLLTDVNDWGLLMPPSMVDMVEMGYLNGRQEPEFFLANNPTVGQMFLNDKTQYKLRHEYNGAVIAYQSGYKGVVA